MRLSEDKIRKIAHVVFDELVDEGTVVVDETDDIEVRREIKLTIGRWVKTEEQIEQAVRNKLASYSRNIVEGSPEWDVIYRKHYDEELNRRGRL